MMILQRRAPRIGLALIRLKVATTRSQASYEAHARRGIHFLTLRKAKCDVIAVDVIAEGRSRLRLLNASGRRTGPSAPQLPPSSSTTTPLNEHLPSHSSPPQCLRDHPPGSLPPLRASSAHLSPSRSNRPVQYAPSYPSKSPPASTMRHHYPSYQPLKQPLSTARRPHFLSVLALSRSRKE